MRSSTGSRVAVQPVFVPVILSGGGGTRLWPVSRELHPKPFIHMADGQSLLQKAFARAAALPDASEVLTVTNRELYFKTADEYRTVNSEALPTTFILEPFGRNTAPAIALAAMHVAEAYGEEAVMLVLSADHLIAEQSAFQEAVSKARRLAQEGFLVTFGIEPSSPETGYGYIETNFESPLACMGVPKVGNPLGAEAPAELTQGLGEKVGNPVHRFVEKPSLEKAQEYVSSGRYLWNAGIFCFQAGVVLEGLERYAPEVLTTAQTCLKLSRDTKDKASLSLELETNSFRRVPDISIDYALMEKAALEGKVAVVACNIGWSDIGSWSAISDLQAPDESGNRIIGEALLHDATNCYIQSHKRVVGAVGVENLIIVDTPDALLVADRASAQNVKQIVGQLKQHGHEAYRLHTEVHRPWGTYTVLEEGNRFKIKRIVVKPGASLSLQMHHHRSEHWIVVGGMARVVNGVSELFVNANESTFIPAGHQHRLENPGVIDLVMIEVQSGEYLGEDDIVRFDDIYGRTNKAGLRQEAGQKQD